MNRANYLRKNCLIRLLVDVDDSPNRIYRRGTVLVYDNSDRNTGSKPYYFAHQQNKSAKDGVALLRREFEIIDDSKLTHTQAEHTLKRKPK